MPEKVQRRDVLVIGAGFCGTALAAALKHYGVESFSVLEKGDGVGAFWQKTYDRLRLHSPWHRLPHDGDIDAAYPAFKTRDDVVQYFRDYVALHALEAWFQFGETVTSVKYLTAAPTQYRWQVTSTAGTFLSKYVALCTSTCRVPFVPVFPDQDAYQGTLLHSATFQNGKPFQNQKVLVVGSGNSASDIALDLVEHGASKVALLVNGPRHFARLRTQGWLMQCLKLFGQVGPEALERVQPITFGTPQFVKEVKRIDAAMRWLILDMRPYGIPRPESGFGTELLLNWRVPVSDMGTVDHIKKGDIRIITGRVERFTEQGVCFSDKTEQAFDAVVLATGFRHGLEEFLDDHASLLGPRPPAPGAYPITDLRSRSTVWPSLFFVGFDITLMGGLSWGNWGWEVGQKVAEELRS